jgi:hypothetical protein
MTISEQIINIIIQDVPLAHMWNGLDVEKKKRTIDEIESLVQKHIGEVRITGTTEAIIKYPPNLFTKHLYIELDNTLIPIALIRKDIPFNEQIKQLKS